MVGMTVISPVAENAREHARTVGGQFGVQDHSSPELTLDDYAYPPLKGGLAPSEVDIHFWHNEDGTWRAAVSEYDDDGDDEYEVDLLTPELTVALTDAQARQFSNADYFWTLDEAPIWLRDAVTPALAEDSLNPGLSAGMARWRKGRHDRLMAEGAFASSYDNEYMVEFEEEFPSNTAQDAADALGNLNRHEEDGQVYDEDEREKAAAELSRRASVGIGGVLVDLRELKAGDQIALSHLVASDSREDGLYVSLATVERPDTTGADGDVYVRLENDGLLCLPVGARVPAIGYTHQGAGHTPSQIVRQLVRSGALPPEAKNLSVEEAIATHNAGLQETDPAYVRLTVPKA